MPLRRYLWLLIVLLAVVTVLGYGRIVQWWARRTAAGLQARHQAGRVPGREEYERLVKLMAHGDLARGPQGGGNGTQGVHAPDRVGGGKASAALVAINQKSGPIATTTARRPGGKLVGGGRRVGALESLLSGGATEPYAVADGVGSVGARSRGCAPPESGITNMEVDLEYVPTNAELVAMFPAVRPGGRWSPPDCVVDQKVAVVVPFRTRELHLRIFLRYMHRFLQRQRLDYGIYVVDQSEGSAFNRAMLLNIGFAEALRDDAAFSCFVFHDVDHVPVDDLLTYRCSAAAPVHMAAMIDKWNWGLPYSQFVGGVTMQSAEQMLRMNGFSNNYWGWGGEDDDMTQRWQYTGMRFRRPPGGHGRYATVKANHSRSSEPNPQRMALLKSARQRIPHDGLNTLHYKVVEKERHPLYTRVRVLIKHIGLR